MDILTHKERSALMSVIRSKNTRPELRVRKALFKLGFRYRLHSSLFGKPDIYLPKYRAAIFINGCFWHGHDCKLFKLPATRTGYWLEKISKNKERDMKVQQVLMLDEIRVCIVWECALRGKGVEKFTFLIKKIQNWILSGQYSFVFSGKWLSDNYQSASNEPEKKSK